MTHYPPGPAPASVEGFAAAYEALVSAIRTAAVEGTRENAPSLQDKRAPNSASDWKSRVLPLLESKYAAIRAATAGFEKGDATAIARCALEASGLAKDLDNFSLDFADPEHRRQMDALVSRVVLAAYPVYSAAGLG